MDDSSEQFDPEMEDEKVKIRGQQVPMSEVSLHVMKLLKSPEKQEIIISGVEIKSVFYLLGSSEKVDPEQVDRVVTFVNCHFREGVMIKDYVFRKSVSFANTTFDKGLMIESCQFADQLSFRDIESGSGITLDQVSAATLIASEVRLPDDKAVAVRKCELQSAYLNGVEGKAVTITESHFDEFKLMSNPVRQLEIGKSEGKRLMIHDASELTRLRDVTLENDLSIATYALPAGARVAIEDSVVGGKLNVGGEGPRLQGAQLEVSRTRVEGECIIKNPDIAIIQLYRLELQRLQLLGAALSMLSLREIRIARSAEIHEIDMQGRMEMQDAAIEGRLDLDKVRQASDLTLGPHHARAYHVLAINRGAIGDIECRDCSLPMFHIRESAIAATFKLNSCELELLNIENATIQQQIRLTDCRLGTLQMERGRAEGLHIVRRRGIWRRLSLRDSHLDRLSFISYADPSEDTLLPAEIDMRGCTYDDLPRFSRDEDAERRVAFCRELISQGPYDPQPYSQMSRMLRTQGHAAAANEIMFRERVAATESALARSWRNFRNWAWLSGVRATANWVWLWVLRATIGFGIGLRYFRTVPWALAFVLMGALVLAGSEPMGLAPSQSWLWRLGASLDQLLPIVKLSPKYAAFFDERSADTLNFWQNAYFTLHRFAGWLLDRKSTRLNS